MKKIVGCILSSVLLVASTSVVPAASFPDKPITIIVPAAAGGPIDTLTRILGERMRRTLGQPIIIENIGGAAGSIATSKAVRASADGYTLITGIWNTHVANAAVYKLGYDLENDFVPIGLISYSGLLIVGRTSLSATNLKDLIAWLRQNPNQATEGTPGVGSVGHIGGVLFQKVTGTNFSFVPYRGLGPAMQDLIAGRIDLMFDTPATSIPQLKANKIRAFAITADKRLPAAPDVPTVDELGLPDLHVSTWNAFFAPKGTPSDIVMKLNAALREALADAGIQERLGDIGQQIYPPEQQTPKALSDLQRKELEKWTPIIIEAGIKPE
jgi:tripartite-type tricarboxylate transporter receptor subunit TctC